MTCTIDNDKMENLEYLCKNDDKYLIENGYSKLMIAIKNNMPKIARELITTKNLSIFSKDKKNAFLLACEFNMESIAEYIYNTMGYRYLLFEKDNNNNDAMVFICKHKMKKMFEYVRAKKTRHIEINVIEYAELEKVNNNNETLFIIICKNKLNTFGLDLLKDNFDYNLEYQDNEGNTALMYAIKNNLINLSVKLIKKMKNINQQNNDNESAILLSCANNLTKVSIELLKNKKIDLTKIDNNKCTPLIYASMGNNLQIVTEIIKKECNISQIDFQREDALSSAILNNNETIALLIAENWDIDFNRIYIVGKKKVTIINRVLYFGMTILCEYLIKSEKYDLGYIDYMNKTLLMHLVETKYEYLAEFVLKSKQDIKIEHEDNMKKTALIYSAFKNLPRISSIIIKRKDYNPKYTNIGDLDCIMHLLVHRHETIVIEILMKNKKIMENTYNDIYYIATESKMNKLKKYLEGKITKKYIK